MAHRLARSEISDGWVAQAYRFALDPTPRQVEAFVSHAGGARFAYNTMLAAVKGIHKLTTRLSQAHHVIGTETLAVKNMMAAGGSPKRGLNRSLADAGLGEMFRQLEYKAGWYGSRVVKASRWYPSSKLCSCCGAMKAKLHLSERTYQCDSCGFTIDRDLNAAVNLARYAQAETDPSTGVVTGRADRKPSPTGDAGGSETRTRAEVGGNADDGGSASSKEEAT